MSWFKKDNTPYKPFVKNEKVVAVVDLPGIPAGTSGRVKMSNGFSWQRYWVFFENGKQLGQIDKSLLARPKDREIIFQEIQARRESREALETARVSQQGTLLEQLNNPTEPEPAESSTPPESTDAPAESALAEAGTAEDETGEPRPETAATPEVIPLKIVDTAETAPESAPTESAPVSQGSALVDVPDHLLERAAEARSRLS